MRYKLEGNWSIGLAFDLHTVASTYLGPNEYGHPSWDTTRSEIGELIYQLKYKGDKSTIPKIIELLKAINGLEKFDIFIPVPSSNKGRVFQPVDEIVKALGTQRGVETLIGYLEKRAGGPELKSVGDTDERSSLLQGAITITDDRNIIGKRVLLLDDLYQSGATLNACCSVLYSKDKDLEICVLTMTKTRSKR